jgi:hypothetical protein
VPGLSNVVAIAAGYQHTCAIDSSQNLWCWGFNADGELGVGDENPHTGPQRVLDPTTLSPVLVDAVAPGGLRTCAHSTAGQTLCWGSGELSTEMPDAPPPNNDYPAPVLF